MTKNEATRSAIIDICVYGVDESPLQALAARELPHWRWLEIDGFEEELLYELGKTCSLPWPCLHSLREVLKEFHHLHSDRREHFQNLVLEFVRGCLDEGSDVGLYFGVFSLCFGLEIALEDVGSPVGAVLESPVLSRCLRYCEWEDLVLHQEAVFHLRGLIAMAKADYSLAEEVFRRAAAEPSPEEYPIGRRDYREVSPEWFNRAKAALAKQECDEEVSE